MRVGMRVGMHVAMMGALQKFAEKMCCASIASFKQLLDSAKKSTVVLNEFTTIGDW